MMQEERKRIVRELEEKNRQRVIELENAVDLAAIEAARERERL
jgi:HSP20 family molecular chaperone IbpA